MEVSFEGRELMYYSHGGGKVLTTEEGKMYGLYILDCDKVFEVGNEPTELAGSLFDNWFDHCVNPYFFKEYARENGLTYSKDIFNKIVDTYNCNYLHVIKPYETSLNGKRLTINKEIQGKYTVSYEHVSTGDTIINSFKGIKQLNNWLCSNELEELEEFEEPRYYVYLHANKLTRDAFVYNTRKHGFISQEVNQLPMQGVYPLGGREEFKQIGDLINGYKPYMSISTANPDEVCSYDDCLYNNWTTLESMIEKGWRKQWGLGI